MHCKRYLNTMEISVTHAKQVTCPQQMSNDEDTLAMRRKCTIQVGGD
ncbi:hypothetical protein [Paenibacillus marinisediminis]